jgi:hypothetical protein
MIFDPAKMDKIVEHSQEDIAKMQEKLMDALYLPSYYEVKKYFDAVPKYSTEDKNWRDFVDEDYKIYEIYTREFIERLSIFLADQIRELKTETRPIKILEVGAGNGRLTYFLNNSLKKLSSDSIKFIAIDSGESEIKEIFSETPVEKIDYKEALKKYKPQIVICSWMPHDEDWSAAFRAEKSVEEYILIGEEDGCCGNNAETWGDASEKNNPYEADNFERQRLSDLSNVQFSRIDIIEKNPTSKTNLFKRKH